MNLLKYLFFDKRYFLFTFVCGEVTGNVEVITTGHSFPRKEDVHKLILSKLGDFYPEDLGPIVICNIFEFKNESEYKQWLKKTV